MYNFLFLSFRFILDRDSSHPVIAVSGQKRRAPFQSHSKREREKKQMGYWMNLRARPKESHLEENYLVVLASILNASYYGGSSGVAVFRSYEGARSAPRAPLLQPLRCQNHMQPYIYLFLV